MKFFYIIIFLICTQTSIAQSISQIVLDRESSFQITGTSNINQFKCKIKQGFHEGKMAIWSRIEGDKISFKNTSVTINVNQIECANNHITSDLREALKEEEYPTISLELLSISGHYTLEKDVAKTLITMAGKSKIYNLDYDVKFLNDKSLQIRLKANIQLQDFDITPPTALMGLIKVNDTITIDLNFVITLI
ncbi:MAG TPA: YceI family protein [Fulvivirga sp.]|nr:YceI family protein [Fulvivirga sp.]